MVKPDIMINLNMSQPSDKRRSHDKKTELHLDISVAFRSDGYVFNVTIAGFLDKSDIFEGFFGKFFLFTALGNVRVPALQRLENAISFAP